MNYSNFLVFAFDQYYPSGGLDDIVASYHTLEEFKENSYLYLSYDFVRVVDRHTLVTVWRN